MEPRFLSVNDLRARWSCSRSTVYRALREMEGAGYLRRLYIGADQRIATESVEAWERLHATAPGAERAPLARARRNATTKAKAWPSAPSPLGLRETWRKMRPAA